MPKILDGTFYTFIKDVDGVIYARCNECDEVKKGAISSTGNYKTHYKSRHKSKFPDLEAYLEKDKKPVDKKVVQQTSLPDMISKAASVETV